MISVPALITRLVIGFVFLQSGWGKFHHLDKVVEFFTSLNIPLANIQAPFVAGVELIGGALLILGLWTRWVSLPLMFTMVIAIATAKWKDFGGVSDLFTNSEFLILLLLGWLAFTDSGKYSVRTLLKK
jgi:putative oxidoreductase